MDMKLLMGNYKLRPLRLALLMLLAHVMVNMNQEVRLACQQTGK